ncbi:MAG: UrcA family protein [Oxalobacteraceae bacterium]|nr:MAG: UrcA family protein [Oxalobacteraceae bacterium]
MRNFVVPALAALCLSSVAIAPAAAEELTVKVAHADLKLSTAAGKKALETRIAVALKTACAKPEFMRDLKAMQAWENCKEGASAGAYDQLDESVRMASL